ncbi:MAG: esterase/lipase family protein [Chloroflexota bacterium]
MTDLIEPPDPSHVIREARGLIELPRLFLRFPALALQPRGHGQPVLILPGYGAGDGSTMILKSYLLLLGYRARGWGLGRNKGAITELLPRILKRASSLARRNKQKVHLIGWSFGGYLARELARERADLIGKVITLGTPVVGGPKYTVVANWFRSRGVDVDEIAAEVERRNQIALHTQVIALYSRRDSMVAWQACIDRNASNVEHIEVHTTHFGLGFSPEVYKIIAQRLAAEPMSKASTMEQIAQPRG